MLPPWRSPLSRALHRNRSLPYARYAQLATVRPDGRPANRTIVFRGFLEETGELKFITDTRSEKVDQIQANPWTELCWYFPTTREQFRITGQLRAIGVGAEEPMLHQARQHTWQELSDAARIQFVWPASGQARANPEAFSPAQPEAATPVENFCLLLLQATQVDHLELRGEPQNRWRYFQAGLVWQQEAINP